MKRQAASFCFVVAFCLATTASPAQTFTTLASFHKHVGYSPSDALIQGADGNLYGGASSGGSYRGLCSRLGCGTVFKVSQTGQLTAVHKFDDTEASSASGPLVLARDGNFYGTTGGGGNLGCGTIFKLTPDGTLTTLFNFNCADGFGPTGLIEATDGNFYGTTTIGGVYYAGTVFKITPAGVGEVLHNFTGGADGQLPAAGLIQAADGNFYGTTSGGGANSGASQFCPRMGNQAVGCGTVFKITPKGKLTTLFKFCSKPDCADGAFPLAGLIQGADGNLYGTTLGKDYRSGGTVFRVTTEGVLTTLYTFCSQVNCADGKSPNGLIQATDGNLYGTAEFGGNDDDGTAFKMTLEGNLTNLHTFCSRRNCNDGSSPIAAMVQGTDGNLYGTTSEGGPRLCPGIDNVGTCGTVFSLSLGLAPFVETIPTSGRLGAKVIVLGNNLTGTTTVSFDGTPAKFKVVSDTEITTRILKGTTTGPVTVTTPSGTLTSNVPFIVR